MAERTKDTDLLLLTLAESCESMHRIILAYTVLKSEPLFGGLVWLQLHIYEASFQACVQLICAGIHRDKCRITVNILINGVAKRAAPVQLPSQSYP
jgi:hypothetical protein